MHEYDVTLKLLLRDSAKTAMRELAGGPIRTWHNVELPKIQNRRVDLLGECVDGTLVHLELQSANDASMPLRMAEYALGVYRQFEKFPRQIVLYVGEAEARMETRLDGPRFTFAYEISDVRDLDGDRLLGSDELGDNVLAILTRLRDRRQTVREIIARISDLEAPSREFHLSALLILAGLRGLEEVIETEARKMPILNDILDHKVLGREFKKGLAQGQQQGEHQEALRMLRRVIEARFGALPEWAERDLADRSTAQLEDLNVRTLDAPSLEDLLN